MEQQHLAEIVSCLTRQSVGEAWCCGHHGVALRVCGIGIAKSSSFCLLINEFLLFRRGEVPLVRVLRMAMVLLSDGMGKLLPTRWFKYAYIVVKFDCAGKFV